MVYLFLLFWCWTFFLSSLAGACLNVFQYSVNPGGCSSCSARVFSFLSLMEFPCAISNQRLLKVPNRLLGLFLCAAPLYCSVSQIPATSSFLHSKLCLLISAICLCPSFTFLLFLWSITCLQAKSRGACRSYLTDFSCLRDHSSALPVVQHPKTVISYILSSLPVLHRQRKSGPS